VAGEGDHSLLPSAGTRPGCEPHQAVALRSAVGLADLVPDGPRRLVGQTLDGQGLVRGPASAVPEVPATPGHEAQLGAVLGHQAGRHIQVGAVLLGARRVLLRRVGGVVTPGGRLSGSRGRVAAGTAVPAGACGQVRQVAGLRSTGVEPGPNGAACLRHREQARTGCAL